MQHSPDDPAGRELDRRVVVLVVPAVGTWAPPGRSADAWRLALAEDTYEVLASLDRVDVAVAVVGGDESSLSEIAALTWPGTPVYSVDPSRPILDAVLAAGPAAAVVAVSHDAPDLPGLLIGKLFRALSTADLAVCPAEDGTQVALGITLPPAPWLTPALTFDVSLAELEAAKPRRHAVAIGPGWHRLRSAGDLARLDPGLEGWDATRSILRGA
jgi:hypothetical protein